MEEDKRKSNLKRKELYDSLKEDYVEEHHNPFKSIPCRPENLWSIKMSHEGEKESKHKSPSHKNIKKEIKKEISKFT